MSDHTRCNSTLCNNLSIYLSRNFYEHLSATFLSNVRDKLRVTFLFRKLKYTIVARARELNEIFHSKNPSNSTSRDFRHTCAINIITINTRCAFTEINFSPPENETPLQKYFILRIGFIWLRKVISCSIATRFTRYPTLQKYTQGNCIRGSNIDILSERQT